MTTDETQEPAATGLITEFHRLVIAAVDARLAALHGIAALREVNQEGSRSEAEAARREAAVLAAKYHWNALTVVHLFGLIEGQVEVMSQVMREPMRLAHDAKRREHGETSRALNRRLRSAGASGDKIQLLSQFGRDTFRTLMPPLPAVRLSKELRAPDRWEDALRRLWLGPSHHRALPEDLSDTLREIGAVRNVLLHRLGRMDEAALAEVSEGPWTSREELVVLDDELYRRYVAALYTYALELIDRIRTVIGLPSVNDLAGWRSQVPAGG